MSLVLLVLALSLLSVHAQTAKLFQWQFSNNFLSTSLPSCQPFPITVKLFDANNDTSSLFGPPFYMMAFEVGGTPRTTLLGVNETNLNWLVDHPIGTQLMLSVVDANGSPGGVPPQLYTVVTGQSTSCIQTPTAPSASDFTVSANVTDNVTTCQPWGIRIKGGVPPYNLTLAALNSPFITNVTLLGRDDAFTYIDRADPNGQLLAAISDLTGRWAAGTPIVHTQGSSNVDCVGLVSSSGNSTQLAQQAADAAAAAEAARKHKTSVIVGVCVTLAILLILAGAGFAYWYTRKRRRLQAMAPERQLDMSIKPFEEMAPSASEGQVLSINSWVNPSNPGTPNGMQSLQYSSSVSSTVPNRDSTAERPGSSSSSKPGFASFPVRKVRNAKSIEAGLHSPTASTAALSGVPEGSSEGVREYVIQHRDGGDAVVRELPPPYAVRTGAGSSA